jgi:hypothetical protein
MFGLGFQEILILGAIAAAAVVLLLFFVFSKAKSS